MKLNELRLECNKILNDNNIMSKKFSCNRTLSYHLKLCLDEVLQKNNLKFGVLTHTIGKELKGDDLFKGVDFNFLRLNLDVGTSSNLRLNIIKKAEFVFCNDEIEEKYSDIEISQLNDIYIKNSLLAEIEEQKRRIELKKYELKLAEENLAYEEKKLNLYNDRLASSN